MKLTQVILLCLQYYLSVYGEGRKGNWGKTDNKGIDNSEALASGTEGRSHTFLFHIYFTIITVLIYVTDIYSTEKAIKTHLANYRKPFQARPSTALCAGVPRCKIYEQQQYLVIINFNLICLMPAHQILPQNRTSFKQLRRKCHKVIYSSALTCC